MKYSALAISTILASALARPDINTNSRVHARDVHAQRGAYARPVWNAQLRRREVPQEHSHEKFVRAVKASLDLNNPDGIVDSVFGLLGNAAGLAGQGSITDTGKSPRTQQSCHVADCTDCLQQATADQAFTNAKAAGDVDGMTSALIYRALERNTGKVGLASVPCTALQAVNPEIAAIQQHQDPASAGAAEINTNIAINLAIQISCIGGDPTLALQSGTFAPGDVNDPTAKGNSCDDQNDAEGCIFTQNLLVEDASVDDIMAAVAGATCGGGAAATGAATETATAAALDIAVAAATAPPAAALPTECNITPPADAAVSAVPPPPPVADQGMGAAADQGMGAGLSQAMGGDMGMATSPAPPAMITALPPTAANAAVDCSVQIASALVAAGFSADASDSAAATTAAAAITSVVVEPTPAATNATPPPASGNTALDFGSCPDPTIVFALGFDGRREASFEPSDTTAFTHGSALNIKVITDFICQQLDVKCKADQAAIDACNAGAAAAAAEGGKDQGAADAFNSALGFATAAPPSATGDAGAGTDAGAASVVNFGTCPDPTVVFALGFDGRKEASFEPKDTTVFTHGSALNIKVITDFICQQLATKCGANQAALDACTTGAAAAKASRAGKDETSADAFNAALGF